MNDDFLNGLRQDPPNEFARQLKARLRALDTPARRSPSRATRWAALAASLAAISVSFMFPSVRAGAQAFLDLFRISTFAGVAFDPQRLAELGSNGLDWPQIIGEQVEVLEQPAAPVSYATPEEAGTAAGIRVYQPTWTPRELALTETTVAGGTAVRFTASTAKLQLLLDSLGIDDVSVPTGIDGQQASVHVSPIVTMTYTSRTGRATLVQSRSPDVSFPAGLDLPALAEIGLRILGLNRREAYRIAQSVDWRTTLLVPVPVNAASFEQVDVQGESGLIIESSGRAEGLEGRPGETTVLWSHAGNVYALHSGLPKQELIVMAQSLQ
jgi:hypothetical protein